VWVDSRLQKVDPRVAESASPRYVPRSRTFRRRRFGATVSAPPFRRSPFRRWDFSALGHLDTGRFGADRFGAGHVIDADGTRAV